MSTYHERGPQLTLFFGSDEERDPDPTPWDPEDDVNAIFGTEGEDHVAVRIPSRSTPGVEHVVTRHSDRAASCSCAGFYFRKTCAHLAALESENPMDGGDPMDPSTAREARR